MSTILRTRLIKIGNSQGLRIPKTLIDQAHLPEDVEMEVDVEQIVIRPARRARQGWEEQFHQMALRGDDLPLEDLTISTSTWDDEEWEW